MSTTPGLGIIVAGAVGSFGATKGMKARRSIGKIIAQVTVEEKHHDELEVTQHPVEQGANIADHAFKRPNELTLRVAWSNSPGQPASLLQGLSGALTNQLTGTVQNQITGAAFKQIGGSAIGNLAVANLAELVANPLISYGASVNNAKGRGTSTVQDVYQQLLDLMSSMIPFDVYTGKRKYESMVITSITTDTTKLTENSLECLIVCKQVIIVKTTVVAVAAPASDQASPEKTAAPTDEGTKQLFPVQVDQGSTLEGAIRTIYSDGSFVDAFPIH